MRWTTGLGAALFSLACCAHGGSPARPSADWASPWDIDESIAALEASAVVVARTGAAPCAASDAAGCTAACDAGNGWACAIAGDLDEASSAVRAHARYLRACDLHDPDGCAEVALADFANSFGSPWEAHALLYLACAKGSLRACLEGPAVFEHRIDQYVEGEAVVPEGLPLQGSRLTRLPAELALIACRDLHHVQTCRDIGAYDDACAIGDADACEIAAGRAAIEAERVAAAAAEKARWDALTPAEQAEETRALEAARAAERAQDAADSARRDAEAAELQAAEARRHPYPDATYVFLVKSECDYVTDQLCRPAIKKELANQGIDPSTINIEPLVSDCMWRAPLQNIHNICMHIQCGPTFKTCMLHEHADDPAQCQTLVTTCGLAD